MSYPILKSAYGTNLASSSSIASALNGPITNVSIGLSSSPSDYQFMYKST